jgi:hypothetical protein
MCLKVMEMKADGSHSRESGNDEEKDTEQSNVRSLTNEQEADKDEDEHTGALKQNHPSTLRLHAAVRTP